jgi:orotate phosphoribosyltransferase
MDPAPMTELRRALITLVEDRGLERREEPFQLSSGELSHDYIDAKRAISRANTLALAAKVALELVDHAQAEFDAVGGLTMGADALAVGVAMADASADRAWFSVRKRAKEHGTGRRIEGGEVTAGTRVVLVDDVITTGGSILEALDVVEAAGATVVFATTVVDRGTRAAGHFEERGIPYEAMMTYEDLGIEPIGVSGP